jgi:putative Holliday junction resolvase
MLNETKKEVDLLALKNIVESKHKILGLDLGKKRIGISISTSNLDGALPLRTIQYSGIENLADELYKIITTHEAKAIIVGLPINMDGSEGKSSQSVRDKTNKISSFFDLPYAFWDERLSTAAVNRLYETSAKTRQKRGNKKKDIDNLAAAFILEGALEYIKRNS